MPFILSKSFIPGRPLYAVVTSDDDWHWQPDRGKATRMDEARADRLAEQHNHYSETEVLVEGARQIAGPAGGGERAQ